MYNVVSLLASAKACAPDTATLTANLNPLESIVRSTCVSHHGRDGLLNQGVAIALDNLQIKISSAKAFAIDLDFYLMMPGIVNTSGDWFYGMFFGEGQGLSCGQI